MAVLERLVEAELALGRHEDAIPRLRPVVDEHPYRERFVAQLMLALYRAARTAEALDIYERSRQALARDLGLQPSVELQRLSAEIVRQDPRLASRRSPPDDTPVPARTADAVGRDGVAAVRRHGRHVTRRNTVAALIVLVAAAASGVVFAIGAGPGSGSKADPNASARVAATTRVGLVLPRQPTTSDDVIAPYVDGLLEAKRRYGVETETLVVDPSAQRISSGIRKKIQGLDLVLLGGPAVHDSFVDEVPRNPDTHFVFVDPSPSWEETQVNRFPNSTDIFFIEGRRATSPGTWAH